MRTSVLALRQRYYPGYDQHAFLRLVEQSAARGDHVLEIGCGLRNNPALRHRVACYAGIDPDQRAVYNRALDHVKVGRAEDLPWPDATFDLVFHRMVAEHIEDPVAAMKETARVLKPGGRLLFETVSRWHYAMVAAALTPHWFHVAYLRFLGSKRALEDGVFPTVYRCNTRRAITRALSSAGLELRSIRFVSMPPGYLSFHPAAFALGIAWERTVERFIPALRTRIVVEAVAP